MTERPHLIELTAEIVASFVSCNPLPAADLPGLRGDRAKAMAVLDGFARQHGHKIG